MVYTPFTLALALIPATLQIGVASRMKERKITKEFPVFFRYNIFHVVAIFITLIAARGSLWTYFFTYWGFELLDVFFTLAVLQELYRNTFRPFGALRGLGDTLFLWASAILCGMTVISAVGQTGSDSNRIMAAILIFSRSSDFVIAGLLCLLYGLAGGFGIKWSHRALSISLGLAVIAVVGSAATTIRFQLGEVAHPMYRLIKPLAYNLACAFWVGAVYVESKSGLYNFDRFRRLSEWSRVVQEIGNR